jgi:hypothetical protein
MEKTQRLYSFKKTRNGRRANISSTASHPIRKDLYTDDILQPTTMPGFYLMRDTGNFTHDPALTGKSSIRATPVGESYVY